MKDGRVLQGSDGHEPFPVQYAELNCEKNLTHRPDAISLNDAANVEQEVKLMNNKPQRDRLHKIL